MELGTIQAFVAVASAITGGVIVQVANVLINARGVQLNVQKAVTEATTAAIGDLSRIIDQLREEDQRKNTLIEALRTRIKELEDRIEEMKKIIDRGNERVIQHIDDTMGK